MSDALAVEQVLAQAGQKEKDYDWLGAVEYLKRALSLVSEKDSPKTGELYERSGYALFRAALQAANVDDFRESDRQAIEDYEKARELYRKLDETGPAGRALRCDAMTAYVGYGLTGNVSEKKRLLGESWRLAKESLSKFDEGGEAYEYAKTYNQLSLSASFADLFEESFEVNTRFTNECLERGELAIKLLSPADFPEELSRSLVIVSSCLEWIGYTLPDPEEQEKYVEKAKAYWAKARGLSEETALLEASLWVAGGLGPGSDEALTVGKEVHEKCKKTKDHLAIGSALESLAFHVYWKAVSVEDPIEAKSLLQEALKYTEDARTQYAPILFTSAGTPTMWSEAPYSEYYTQLARFETDQLEKHSLLQKSVDAAKQRLELARDSGYPMTISTSHHVLSKALAALARGEKVTDRRRSLLEKALEHRKEAVKINERLYPYAYWDTGVYQNYLADIKLELAQLEENPASKKNIFYEALEIKQRSLSFCAKVMPWIERTNSVAQVAWIGERQFEYGNLWNSFHSLTDESGHLKESIHAFELAADSFQKANQPTRIAECWWRAAQESDSLGEHLKAADNFERASSNFRTSAGKYPRLGDFYTEHASYMDAWSGIEKARYHHGREEYGLAKECYEKAASLHNSTRRWKYLVPNYSAWALVENAEDLSRREQILHAIEAFRQASQLFDESKESLQAELGRIENLEEKQMVAKLVRAADQRKLYCAARVSLEEGRLLEKKGDHSSSAEKYGRACEQFEKIAENVESENTRRELRLIATLSKAWRMMARAEDESSPGLYLDASRLFDEAKELSPSEKSRSLALGHSRFCKALEAGTTFTDTGDSSLHASALQQLESASKYYLKADFKTGAEYAKATQLLFDAFAHTDRGKKEEDPEKKTRLYIMAEKELQAATEAYLKAEQPAKREQVLKLLDKVKEERTLAASLAEVLHGSPIVSTTATFAAPEATRESAVGLDSFEHANVQASVIARQKDLNVGEDWSLDIELVNAGRGTAQLMKLEEVVPKGFELTDKPDLYRVEDSYLNLRGKRLDSLKTEEVKLLLKPKARGTFILRPRILYLDENGKYKSHEPEPVQVTVKELGISGWIKGRQ